MPRNGLPFGAVKVMAQKKALLVKRAFKGFAIMF
jgi:hypothetical protein